MSRYVLHHYRAGQRIEFYDDVQSLSYEQAINQATYGAAVFGAGHRIAEQVEQGDELWVWRHAPGVEPYIDWRGRVEVVDIGMQDGRETVVLTLGSPLVRLSERIVGYYSDDQGRGVLVGVPAATAMREIVRTNFTEAATAANGRVVGGRYRPESITVESGGYVDDAVRDWDVYLGDVLELLQEMAAVGGVDFDLARVGDELWEFRVTKPAVPAVLPAFSVANENMGNPRLVTDLYVPTIAIGVGQGEADQRITALVYASDYTALNHREIFVSADTAQSYDSVRAQAEAALTEARRDRQRIMFEPLQSDAARYGRDYLLGSFVEAAYRGAREVHRVVKVGVNYVVSGDSPETIDITTERHNE